MVLEQLTPDYQDLLSPEEWKMEMINETYAREWFRRKFPISFPICAIYILGVFYGKRMMEKREKYDLRNTLACWSGMLAAFSIVGSIRCMTGFKTVILQEGVKGMICSSALYDEPIIKFWGMAFTLSKIPELFDTAFIVLRKQKLIFLHWYHHITVLLFTWYCYAWARAGGCVFMFMNLIIHAVMYSYYACRASRIKIPRWIAKMVTALQILQMFLGVSTVIMVYIWRHDPGCRTETDHLMYSGAMYLSYLILFCAFFYQAYMAPRECVDHKRMSNVDQNRITFKTMPSCVTNGGVSCRKTQDTSHVRRRRERLGVQ